MLDGPAGCGKTRLALHMGQQLQPEWMVGWLKEGTGAALVDDADTRPDLGALLAALPAAGDSGSAQRLHFCRVRFARPLGESHGSNNQVPGRHRGVR